MSDVNILSYRMVFVEGIRGDHCRNQGCKNQIISGLAFFGHMVQTIRATTKTPIMPRSYRHVLNTTARHFSPLPAAAFRFWSFMRFWMSVAMLKMPLVGTCVNQHGQSSPPCLDHNAMKQCSMSVRAPLMRQCHTDTKL